MGNRRRKILVIDDSEAVLSRIKLALLSQGYDVVSTTYFVGNTAYVTSFDLVIVDYHMRGMNGAAVVRSMRGVPKAGQSSAFYLYTSDMRVALDHHRLGFDGVFTAKGDDAALLRQVGSFFRLAAMRELRLEAKGYA